MTPRLATYPSPEALAEGVADRLAADLKRCVADAGAARIAVPGGTTPGPMLARLGEADVAWDRVAVTLTDERIVPADSPRANQRLLAETLFRGAAAGARFVPLHDASAGATMAATLAALARNVLPLDIAVLGMGEDMHTASLFPGADGLDEALAADAPAAVAIRPAAGGEARVTLSAAVLGAAPDRHILIIGAAKRRALDRAAALGDVRQAPILAVLDGATVHYAD